MARWTGSNCEIKNPNIISAIVFKSNYSLLLSPVNNIKLKFLCIALLLAKKTLVYRNQIYLLILLTKTMYVDANFSPNRSKKDHFELNLAESQVVILAKTAGHPSNEKICQYTTILRYITRSSEV